MPRLLIHYVTDESVSVVLRGERHTMTREDHGWWSLLLEPPNHPTEYSYVVHTESGDMIDSDHTPRSFDGRSTVIDRWMGHDATTRTRRSALFTKVIGPRYTEAAPQPGRVTFRLLEPNLGPDTTVIVTGETDALGNWDPDAGIELLPAPYPWWVGAADLAGGDYEYKYVVDNLDFAEWEQGPDRFVRLPDEGDVRIDDEGLMNHPGWSGAGVAIPVFSLRTERSLGVGQFTDLVPFIDWAADAGFSILQILPVNDTRKTDSWDDSYPYDPVSVFALHPLYIDIEAMPGHELVAADIASARRRLDARRDVAYEDVMAEKMRLLRALFAEYTSDDTDLAEYVDAEWAWLGPYSAWQALREATGAPDMATWGPDAAFDQRRVDTMHDGKHGPAMRFHWWVQYHLSRQLADAVAHARSRGVALKGDLPIGVSPNSVEVWQHPGIFHIDGQAGAPPDDFAVRGQNWGFPTYDWGAMSGDDYAWWRNRFATMADTMDVYRIDHVLGFFRIWEVPADAVDGLLGHFRPCLPLTRTELHDRLGEQSIARLLRPTIDGAILERRFGEHAGRVRKRFFEGDDADLYFPARVRTQRDIIAAVADGALDAITATERTEVQRGLLDLAADAPLLEIEGGYHPRIGWDTTETFVRLDDSVQAPFHEMAIDFMHHRHSDMWERRGRRALSAVLGATDMLACGEDLGMVPAEVPAVMHDLGLLSLEIERMPKRLGQLRADPMRAPYLSVVSPSTHDTSTLRTWWEEDPAASAAYWHELLGATGSAPPSATPEVVQAILARHLASPAMLCIAPLADWLGIDAGLRRPDDDIDAERINEPADRHHHWRYRMHLPIEALRAAKPFTEAVRRLIEDSGRI